MLVLQEWLAGWWVKGTRVVSFRGRANWRIDAWPFVRVKKNLQKISPQQFFVSSVLVVVVFVVVVFISNLFEKDFIILAFFILLLSFFYFIITFLAFHFLRHFFCLNLIPKIVQVEEAQPQPRPNKKSSFNALYNSERCLHKLSSCPSLEPMRFSPQAHHPLAQLYDWPIN